jgi:hypothetical protein
MPVAGLQGPMDWPVPYRRRVPRPRAPERSGLVLVSLLLVAPRSAKLVAARGSRFTLLTGDLFRRLGFLTMLLV